MIAVDGRFPGPILLNARVTLRPRITGVERLAQEIIGRLVCLRPDVYRAVAPASGRLGPGLQAWEQVTLPAQAARRRSPLIYSPANLAPLAWPRNVLVLHDASVWRTPDSFSPLYGAWHRRAEAAAARRAVLVITVSEFSRRELVELLALDPGRVAVVPGGVAERFRAGLDPEPVRARYGLRRPYVLALASRWARKNVGLLGPLSRRLAAEGIETVLAGVAEVSPGQQGTVRALGYVEDEDLPGLYAGAEVFVFPSLYEGFGLPCVEAMACGTPVVAADRAALPETCAGAALLADPEDAESFTEAVWQAVSDPALRLRLGEAGRHRARELTWASAAAATDALLCDLAARL